MIRYFVHIFIKQKLLIGALPAGLYCIQLIYSEKIMTEEFLKQ